MAIPWYSAELPLSSLNLTESRFISEENENLDLDQPTSPNPASLNNHYSSGTTPIPRPHNLTRTNKDIKMWPFSTSQNVIAKSNNLFTFPDKISKLDHNGNNSEGLAQDVHLYHTGIINRAFFPMRITLMAIGRWPFHMRLQSTSGKPKKGLIIEKGRRTNNNSLKVNNYDASLKSPLWLYFAFTSTFIFYVLVTSTVGFFDLFLEWKLLPCCQWSDFHRNIFRENLVIFLLVWGCLVHSTLSSFAFLLHRKRIAKILNYWNFAADELFLDDLKKQRRFIIGANVGYLLFLVLIYIAYKIWRVPIVRDGAELFGTVAIRPLVTEEMLDSMDTWKLRVFGIVTIIYAIYASRSFLFLFCFKCRLLKSMFRAWNLRLVRFLKRPDFTDGDDKSTRDMIEKMESQRLLSDMTILLKMVKQTDKMFATILESYYAVQLLNMCFELYMLAKSGKQELTRSDESARALYIISAVLTLCQNVYFFFTVSLDGAYVGEEAAKGMEALRRHAIKPSSSIHRKYLVYNLGFIYSQKIAVTGGKYFTIDRPFIITVLGAVLTYFVIILQIGPSLRLEEKNLANASSPT